MFGVYCLFGRPLALLPRTQKVGHLRLLTVLGERIHNFAVGQEMALVVREAVSLAPAQQDLP